MLKLLETLFEIMKFLYASIFYLLHCLFPICSTQLKMITQSFIYY